MKSVVKKAWVKALRSGEFKQGTIGLRNLDDTYDPVGVLCELAVREGIIGEPTEFSLGFIYGVEGDASATACPKVVLDWAGLKWYHTNRLIRMNDSGEKFTSIAGYIEKEF